MSAPESNTPKNPHAVFVQKLVEYMDHRKAHAARKKTICAMNSLGRSALRDLAIDRSEISSIVHSPTQERRREYTN